MNTITIAIPIYNVEKYIEKSLSSALEQDFIFPYEILVINDNSPDNSLDIVYKIKNEHRKGNIIRIIDLKQNKGQGEVRNIAINETKSKYLFFLDSDDYMTKDCLRLLYDKAESSNAEITFGSVDRINEKTNLSEWINKYKDETIEHNAVGLYLFLKHEHIHIECWNKLYRMDFLLKYNIKNVHRVMEDVVFDFLCNLYARRFAFISQVTMIYNIRSGSTLTEIREKKGNDFSAFAYSDIPRCLRDYIKNDFKKVPRIWDYYAYKVMDMCRNLSYSEYTESQKKDINKRLNGMLSQTPGPFAFSQPIDRFMYFVCLIKEDYNTYNHYRYDFWNKHRRILEFLLGTIPSKIRRAFRR